MPRSPSIVPDAIDSDVYLVLDDFGHRGRSWRETDEETADRAALVRALLEGQYNAPVRVVSFNIAEGWSRDVSEEIADEITQACPNADENIPAELEDFVERHGGRRTTQLPLPLRHVACLGVKQSK